MKNIYNNILKISIPISMLIILNGCSKLNYQQDEVYTENKLPGYVKNNIKENISSNIQREAAMKKALEVLNDGFEEDLDREALYESVSLIDAKNYGFIWQINFTENRGNPKENNYYYVGIDAENGKVREVIINKYKKEDKNKVEDKGPITQEEIKSIINQLEDVLDINIDYDEMFIKKDIVQVINLKKKVLKHEFRIDKNNKKITAYYYYKEQS